jgi:hypothetical protein
MPDSKISEIKAALDKLIVLALRMRTDLLTSNLTESERKKKEETIKESHVSFIKNYQRWYTEAYAAIKQLLPDRLAEFASYYEAPPRRKNVNTLTYVIQDWMIGLRHDNINSLGAVTMRFRAQLQILESVKARFDSRLLDIRQLVQADLFDSELDAALELLKNGFLRGAGAVAGVVLEKHLAEVCINHEVQNRKKNPTINDFNQSLKDADAIDIPSWRFIQRLGDLRNICGHNKDREPTKSEVTELIDGVSKITKSIF